MIVTTGSVIKIDAGYQNRFNFYRDAEAPGVVILTCKSPGEPSTRITLPANDEEMLVFINAYRRAVEEPIAYRKSEVEGGRRDSLRAEITRLQEELKRLEGSR
jgi:hypothetical protein